MAEKQQITEEMGVHEDWYKEARVMELENLPEFLRHILEDYEHDYGTICHALAAGAMAVTWGMNRHPEGGITGFQASCVMWEYMRRWMYPDNKTGLRILDYDKMLYPVCRDNFSRRITPETWAGLQKAAAERLAENDEALAKYELDRKVYGSAMANFVCRYPDYYERPEYYDHLDFGTADEWEAYDVKKEAGFEFAPRKVYDPGASENVVRHWQSIVDGVVPFGYTVEEE